MGINLGSTCGDRDGESGSGNGDSDEEYWGWVGTGTKLFTMSYSSIHTAILHKGLVTSGFKV